MSEMCIAIKIQKKTDKMQNKIKQCNTCNIIEPISMFTNPAYNILVGLDCLFLYPCQSDFSSVRFNLFLIKLRIVETETDFHSHLLS